MEEVVQERRRNIEEMVQAYGDGMLDADLKMDRILKADP